MPTYDYVCDACGHKFELFQSMSAPVERKCPQCKKLKLRRLFGAGAALVFKGSGFYQTDYRSDSYKKAAEKDSASSGESSNGKGDAKSDAPAKSSDSASAKPEASSGKSSGEKSPKRKSKDS